MPDTLSLADLDTPALILDRAVLDRNLAAMQARARRHGVALRPHLKTAKSAEIARRATQGGFGGITVSTLAEARYFAAHGFTDILYAVGIVPSRLPAIQALRRQGAAVKIITDSPQMADAIAARGTAADPLEVLIEIDSGAHRAGLAPGAAELMETARRLHQAPHAALLGVMTHAGHSYHCADVAGVRDVAEQERLAVVKAAARLRAAGIPCPVVSVGSTPTAIHARTLDGVTEMRPGVYMFNDLDQLALGSCGRDGLALSVLARVVGHYPARNQLLIDAGALALSKDLSATEFMPDIGYGLVEAVDGAGLAGLRVSEVNQEHGFVTASGPLPFDRLPIGAVLRVWPNHACITAAAYDRYHVVDPATGDGRAVIGTWDRVNGW